MVFKIISVRQLFFILIILLIAIFLYLFSGTILRRIGKFLILDEKPTHSDAAVVLCVGMEYYPRLIEAAELFREGFARKVVINGNRKTDVLRSLERKGFEKCCPWYENSLRILSMLGVPREKIVCISAEDAYDTVSEAEKVGKGLIEQGFTSIILTTSKFHTRRAHFIWAKIYKNQLSICTVAAKADPYEPQSWWKEGRQIRWVISEYGAWMYYWWKGIKGI